MQQVQAQWTRARSWLGRQSQAARLALALSIVLAGVTVGALVGSRGQAGQSPASSSWVTVVHIAGTQNQVTPTYHVPIGARIVWVATPTDQNGGGYIAIELDDTIPLSNGSAIRSLGLLANTGVRATPQTGTTFMQQDYDLFFTISALKCAYDIQVQVYRS